MVGSAELEPATSSTREVPTDPEELLETSVAEGWGDGLPLVPPSQDRVQRHLVQSGLDPDEEIGAVPPALRMATNSLVATNAVMAGCGARHLPYVVAAVRAMLDASFNLQAIQTTTNPVGVGVLVNGPARQDVGFNGGTGCLGPGWRANASVGRAVRLVLMNIGGGKPGEVDSATHGFPGKYTFCFAENESENPWEPFHRSRGFDTNTDVVTVFGVAGTVSVIDPTSSSDELLRTIGRSLRYPGSNDYIFRGAPLVILGPEHARVLAESSLSRAEVQARLHEESEMSLEDFSGANLEYWLERTRAGDIRSTAEGRTVRASSEPSDIAIVVAGGPSIHSMVVPTYGVTRPVSKEITR